MKNNLFVNIGIVLILITGIWVTGSYLGYNDQYDNLVTKYEVRAAVDNTINASTWEFISSNANVDVSYRDGFERLYPAIMDTRVNCGTEALLDWLRTTNPAFTPDESFTAEFEARRFVFTENHRDLTRLYTEITGLTARVPSKWFITTRPLHPPRPRALGTTITKGFCK